MLQSSPTIRALFAVPDYRRLWTIGALVGLVRWLEFLALGIFAYQVTQSPSHVALIALVRMLPYVVLGFLVGALADYLNKQRMLAVGFLVSGIAFAVMAALSALGLAGYGTALCAAFLTGLLWTTDLPVRRRLLVEAAGVHRMTAALGFDNSNFFATRAAGPIIGGVAYQMLGIEGILALSAAVYLTCFYLSVGLKDVQSSASDTAGEGSSRPSVLSLLIPPRELILSRRFQVVLGVTVVFNIWCFPFLSMVPVIGEKEFGLTPALIGALSACEGIGGTIGAILIGLLAGQRPQFPFYYFGVMGFLVLMLGLSASLTLGTTVIGLLLIGVSASGFSAIQYALIYTMSPPDMRGRAAGFLSIFIGTSTLGFYNTGFVFSRFETAEAMMVIAIEGLIPLVILGVLWIRAKS